MPSGSPAPRRNSKRVQSSPDAVLPGVDDAASIVAKLQRLGTQKTRDGMSRYAIPSDKAFGVPVGTLKTLAKKIGQHHNLALELWETGWYEARMLASFVDDPAAVTSAQMDRWCREFDNWAICDTVCFALFDRTPHAWTKVELWSTRRAEFSRRGAFALLWGLTVHDKSADDGPFLRGLDLIESAAEDERHFVQKGINMALRAVGKRNPTLHAAAVETATRLSDSPHDGARLIGTDALRELNSSAVRKRLAGRG
ncbi:DNA alkylation repair protein [Planctomyces sp. SH-PL14]|uniref:DNA alkylation repair protein n=1 Tax=Planctomyces sp. SH-PL14 TaxID=1632864 RepID=UPI00078D6DD1|nr:DNA alkylation repair protein [Planctomyces sp. SH-PL14]AMV21528.1 DNA alkylation repair enzyme [Planctomyces sp. SH-PL14]